MFLSVAIFLVLTSRTSLGFNDFQIVHIHKKWRRPLLYQLFTKAVHKSTLVEPNQMMLGFVITNDLASCVARVDSICLFSVAKEAALNKQWIKPCVPLKKNVLKPSSVTVLAKFNKWTSITKLYAPPGVFIYWYKNI